MLNSEISSRFIRTADSEAFLFFTDFGQNTGELAISIPDFLKKLSIVPSKSIEFHFNRGDFENWIRETLDDKYLSKRIGEIDRSTQGEELRTEMQRIVMRHLNRRKAKSIHLSNSNKHTRYGRARAIAGLK